MRDCRKDEQYWNELIEKENFYIKEFGDELNITEPEDERKIRRLSVAIMNAKYAKIVASYSKGESLTVVRDLLTDYIKDVPRLYAGNIGWGTSFSVTKMLETVSLSHMLNVDKETWLSLSDVIIKSSINDWLVAYLISSIDGTPFDENLEIRVIKPYQKLREAIEKPTQDQQLKAIIHFLQKVWYQQSKDQPWYNTLNNRNNVYQGYWSFETGAVVKILKLNDELLKDIDYYPYDLVHYTDT